MSDLLVISWGERERSERWGGERSETPGGASSEARRGERAGRSDWGGRADVGTARSIIQLPR